MNTPHSEKSERERQLDELVTAYLKAVEAGEHPNREDWLARHPEFASELAAFFDAQEQVDRLAGCIRAPDAWDAPTLPPDQPNAVQGTLGVVRYFGDYELLEEVARGGMGVVYKARQVSLQRVVALKMILAGQLASAAEVQRFHKEAEAAANVDHANIVPIYEVGEHEGQHYFSMKLVEGGSLADHMRRFNADPRAAVRLLATVAGAVHCAHQHGILHRDLKPSNILLDDKREPHVTDFGLAKRVEGDKGLTHSGAIVGTPSYMAPEQAAAKKGISTATDVYSLGAILYELLTGRPPFQATTPLDTVLQVLSEDPVPPRRLVAKLPKDLETICLKCLEKEPSRRYASADALAEDLRRFLRGVPVHARPLGTLERTFKWVRRRPAVAALAGLIVLVTVVGFPLVTWLWRQATSQAGRADRASQNALAIAKTEAAAKVDAVAQRREAQGLAVKLALDRGVLLCEQGEIDQGMLWLANALERAPNDRPGLQRGIRTLLAGWRPLWHPVRATLHPSSGGPLGRL